MQIAILIIVDNDFSFYIKIDNIYKLKQILKLE